MQSDMSYEYLDHTADIAVRLRAPDLSGLLGAATLALRDILVEAGTVAARGGDRVTIALEAEDEEALLVDYLNELLFLFDTRKLLPCDLRVTALPPRRPPRLEAILEVERFDPDRHSFKTEVKAATFHGIEIRKESSGLVVDVVFDL